MSQRLLPVCAAITFGTVAGRCKARLASARWAVLGKSDSLRMRQFSRFLLVGFTNTALGYAVIFCCMYLVRLSPELSNVVGYIIGLVASYFLNRNYTFRSIQRRRSELIRFVVVFLIAYMMNLVALVVFIRLLGVYASVSQVIAGVVYISIAYLLNKRYVFNTTEIGSNCSRY